MSVAINLFKKLFIHRYDDGGYIKYFCADDFEGLKKDSFSFMSGDNLLKGNFYYYDGYREDELIIFCHGIGGGHLSYMTEIELLCKNGYKVLAYDNTGCFESEGESIICITQALADLDNAIKTMKNDGTYKKFNHVYVIGHSWGGYAAGNIANFHNDIEKAVVISSFPSVSILLEELQGGVFGFLKKPIVQKIACYEKEHFPQFFASSSIDAINNKKAKYLIAHSKDDNMIAFKYGLQYVKEHCKNEDVKYLIYQDRKHNPNYKADAVAYMNEVMGKFNIEVRLGKYKTLEAKKAYFEKADFIRMTRQDEDFWSQVLEFLNKMTE